MAARASTQLSNNEVFWHVLPCEGYKCQNGGVAVGATTRSVASTFGASNCVARILLVALISIALLLLSESLLALLVLATVWLAILLLALLSIALLLLSESLLAPRVLAIM